MSKKQNKVFNFIILFLTASTVAFSTSTAAISEDNLGQADSLFQLQKYTESFDVYEEIYENQGTTSAQMLMKMAFIKEGLGDYSQALFYLNKYYLQTSDKRARAKMRDLAAENQVFGFSIGDTDFFKGQVTRYYLIFISAVFSVLLCLVFIILYRKLKSGSNAIPYAVTAISLMIAFFWVLNFPLNHSRGIIIDNHAFLMTGPSSASDLIEVVKKGHRLEVLDKDGLWVEVEWQGKSAYLRSSKFKMLDH